MYITSDTGILVMQSGLDNKLLWLIKLLNFPKLMWIDFQGLGVVHYDLLALTGVHVCRLLYPKGVVGCT